MRRYRINTFEFWLVTAIGAVLIVTIVMVTRGVNEFTAVLLGAAVTLCFTLAVEYAKRGMERTDLAAAIAHEFAIHVARCQFDFEHPWGARLATLSGLRGFDARKFSPEPPFIFMSAGIKVALLDRAIVGCLVKFYQALAVWRTDLKNSADEADARGEAINDERTRLLALRLRWALEAALPAFLALRAEVPHIDELVENAIKQSDGTAFGPKFHSKYIGKRIEERMRLVLSEFNS